MTLINKILTEICESGSYDDKTLTATKDLLLITEESSTIVEFSQASSLVMSFNVPENCSVDQFNKLARDNNMQDIYAAVSKGSKLTFNLYSREWGSYIIEQLPEFNGSDESAIKDAVKSKLLK